MRTSKKDRRSERVPAAHRMILTILGPNGAEVLKEIITTIEISQHGARIKGRRSLQPNWRGLLVNLNSGRQAPVRIVWQTKGSPNAEYMESGVEVLADFNFWGQVFQSPDTNPEQAWIAIENAGMSAKELLQVFRNASAFEPEQREKVLEAVWCGLVEQLEARKVFTRKELVATVRRIPQG